MFVLHAHWEAPAKPSDAGGLLFWMETSDVLAPAGHGRPGRGAQLHPFCASVEETEETLRMLCRPAQRGRRGVERLLLPTVGHLPQPSPQLNHDWTLNLRKPPVLAPWEVAGAVFVAAEALAVLLALPADADLPAPVRVADDARFWATAAGLALEALAQQKLLPALEPVDERGTRYHARWLPVLDGPRDGPRLAQLAARMPAVCRAAVSTPAEAPAPRTLLDTFLNTMADGLARTWGKARAPGQVAAGQPAGAWLRALFAGDPQVTGSPAQLQRLYASHRAWLRNLHMAGDRHFRIAFRLEAPQQQQAENSDNWLLHFLLQARDDPSLLAPAGMVWQTRGAVLHALGRPFANPQEKLLAGLGYAARLFEPLRRSLQIDRPDLAALSSQEAFTFLRTAAPLLEESGFGVLVPPWWNKPGTRLGVRVRMQPRKGAGADAVTGAGLNLDKLVSYHWELSLGDTALTRAEFDALVALKSPLVQIRGQWVQLDPEQIEVAIHFWQRQSDAAEVSLHDALKIGLGGATVDGLDVRDVVYEGWLAGWMDRFTGNEQLAVLPQPAQLRGHLRPYQQYGFSWLDFLRRWRLGACLADDMGLGKTIQTLAMLLRAKEEGGKLPGPVLLVCPTSVVTNWAREVEHFAPALAALVHQGGQRLRDAELVEQIGRIDLLLTSYAVVRRDAETLGQVEWFGVVLDEAQNIKNAETKQAQVIRRLPAEFRLALTGTPVENRLSELWSIMHFLNPGYLGSRQHFRQHYALPIERNNDGEAVQRLRRLVSPFILRRVKTDPTVIRDLPEKQEMKVYCYLTPEQATLYEAVVREALQQIDSTGDEIQRRGQVLAMLTKLKQICNHPAQFLHQIGDAYVADAEEKRSGKLGRLVELTEELVSVGDRALIFTQYAEIGTLLKSYLQQRLGIATQFLHGGTKTRQRTEMVRRFQEDDDAPPIFILSLKAGGVGLNLTRANHVFHFDRWWNPAVENQATDRAFRIGQRRNVQVHKFVCLGTLEEKIDELIESKQALAASVIGGGEQWLTEFSTAQLREMVTLRRQIEE